MVTHTHTIVAGGALLLMLTAAGVAMLMRHLRERSEVDRSRARLMIAHRQAIQRFVESEKLLHRVEAVSRVGGFRIDIASGGHQWTPQTYRVFDLDDSCPPCLESIDSLLTPAVRPRLREALERAQREGKGFELEIPITSARGRAIWVRITAEVESERGAPARIVGAVQDITDRCVLEQRLRDALAVADRASKSKSEFLANMSHEIRTPLNAVIGLGYLLEQTGLSEEQRQFLAKIQFAGRSLLGVVNNVLDLSKIEADEMSLEDEPFELPALVHDVSQMLLPQAVDKGIDLLVEAAPELPRMVIGDAARMRQILTNLLHNSLKFTERGHVRLAAFCVEHGGGRVRLRCEVSDTGIGIDPAACERLFTPFTQADASTTRRFGGTGLGLSIARRFVELMGGEIGVESQVDVGSTFWIEIPLRLAPEIDGSLARAMRVLIVDPRGDCPRGLGAMVRALGWTPQIVDGFDQMLAVMACSSPLPRPDALVLDLQDRESEAHEWISRLERSSSQSGLPPVIVLAQSPQSYLDLKQRVRGTDVLLVRPVTSSALFNAINLAVSRQPESCDRVFESTNFDELHPQWLSGVRVLVVDDSDINLEVAQRILAKQGALVHTCSDGPSAIRALQGDRKSFDIVLMDVQMPVLDGNEVTRRIRGDLKLDVPIVALTAGALVGERQRALDAGMNDFVSKPFDPQLLIRKVRRWVEQMRGEPIPMVFDDRRQSNSDTVKRLPDSIDAAVVQQMFGDDLPLFNSLLQRMLREHAGLAVAAPACVADNESGRAELRARVHKLKGSAAMIGATQVMRLAGAAEKALGDGRPSAVIAGLLKKLAAALVTLRDEAGSAPEARRKFPDMTDPGGSADACVDPRQMTELCDLLETQNLAAVDQFERLAPSLRSILGAAQFDELQAAVENLDFQKGAGLLRAAPPQWLMTSAA